MKAIKTSTIILILFIIACNSPSEKQEPINILKGNWAFLDKHGTYNEAFFGDSTFFTYNMVSGKMPGFGYEVKDDSLYSNFDKSKKTLTRIAGIEWLSDNRVILSTEFVHDTLEPILGSGMLLSNTDFKRDSTEFVKAHYQRYEAFLISRGILSKEEVKEFKEKGKVPEDVKNP